MLCCKLLFGDRAKRRRRVGCGFLFGALTGCIITILETKEVFRNCTNVLNITFDTATAQREKGKSMQATATKKKYFDTSGVNTDYLGPVAFRDHTGTNDFFFLVKCVFQYCTFVDSSCISCG